MRTSPVNPPGDGCAAPIPLTLSGGNSGHATASGAFADFFEDLSVCWNSSGADAVFSVTTDRARRLHARTKPPLASAGPTLSVRKNPSYDGTSRVAANLVAGTSYLVMKSPLASSQGTFTVDVEVDDFAQGETCAGAIPLSYTGGASSVTGDSYAFGTDGTASCDSSKGPDAFYSFTTTAVRQLTATLRRDNPQEPYALALFPGCAGVEKACKSAAFSSAPVTLTQASLPVGTWVLAVRGGTTRPSGWTLDVALAP